MRDWYVLDASEVPLGRLSTVAARLLIGKNKPTFAPHRDDGDYVVVINAANLVTTGNKANKKIYYSYSGFPGGLRQKTLAQAMAKDPADVIRHAVRGMLPDNKLRKPRLQRLKIYAGTEHQHQAQNPKTVRLQRLENGE